jgi:anthranilate phosphoribosyltransferase
MYPGPNETVLQAQARVCTGPHQTRPLGVDPDGPQPLKILELILDSVRGSLPYANAVSQIQMGAFFGAMTIRKGFPEKTNWSEAERAAFKELGPKMQRDLPPDLKFLLDPSSRCKPLNIVEKEVIDALVLILAGNHLTYDQTRKMASSILGQEVRESLKGAALIGQRMNLETFDEARGYLDAAFDPENILEVATPSLTHFGEPYDGSRRYFRPTIFIAAVRAALGRPTLIHGTDQMPPKYGVTDEQIFSTLGAGREITLSQASTLVEDSSVGFAFLSQRIYSPGAYAARELRRHIQKRPPWAATEKAQMLLRSSGSNHMVIGYYHSGYEDLFLNLIEDHGLESALVARGLEGCSHYSLKYSKPSDSDHKAMNFTMGTKKSTTGFSRYSVDVDTRKFGFSYSQHPRPESVSPTAFAKMGLEALSGQKGEVFDQIVLNVGLKDHLLGFCPDPMESIVLASDAILSGKALAHFNAYIQKSVPRPPGSD